jgi:hypothetical protein
MLIDLDECIMHVPIIGRRDILISQSTVKTLFVLKKECNDGT